MRLPFRLFMTLFIMGLCLRGKAQVEYSAQRDQTRLEVGAGFDYWATDYSQRWKYGPSAWASAEIWRGLGIVAEGHSLIGGGGLSSYKYFVGEGGPMYKVKRWSRFQPYVKGEAGFAGLSVRRTSTYSSHDTRATLAVGGGLEYRTWNRLWTRLDYTYDGFPGFLSFITFQRHWLNPNGFTLGASYHFH